jgi:hypothetical protein
MGRYEKTKGGWGIRVQSGSVLRGLEGMSRGMKRVVPALMAKAATETVLKEAKELAPEGSGKLKKSLTVIRGGTINKPAVFVGSKEAHTIMVERGVKAHRIDARIRMIGYRITRIWEGVTSSPRIARFKGSEVWRWIGKHPGYKGKSFLLKALQNKKEAYLKRLTSLISQAMGKTKLGGLS